MFDALRARVTVFVVGLDAERAAGAAVIRRFADAGHEIASHSSLHRGELSVLPVEEIAEDLGRAAVAIEAATGVIPRGFRCPSFGTSPELMSILAGSGYEYDASVLPTSLGPVLRAYYRLRMRAGRTSTSSPGAGQLFGPNANALLPLSPFRWTTPNGLLLELPVSSLPLLRTPIHMSYIQALAGHTSAGAHRYLRVALAALRRAGVPPSFLLHPTDVIDAGDAPRLGFFPGMGRPWRAKLAQVRRALDTLAEDRGIVPLGDLASSLADAALPERSPGGVRPAGVGAR